MIKALNILLLAIAISSSLIFAQIEKFSPVEVGMSLTSLDKATQRLQEHVDAGDIAGVVAAVSRDGKVVYFESLGPKRLKVNNLPIPRNRCNNTGNISRIYMFLKALCCFI